MQRRWLELALDHRCNLRCIGCHACEDDGQRLSREKALALLREHRHAGVSSLWIGGGEATMREDLFLVVRAARTLGYERVLLQTNGMRLAYPSYVEALARAGVTDVSVNAKSHDAAIHDRLSGEVEGSHALLVKALENLRSVDVRVAADVLLTTETIVDLDETVRFFAARGVLRFVLWLLSAADIDDERVRRAVPRIADLAPRLEAAKRAADEAGALLASLHTPPCALPANLRALFSPARELSLVVVEPDGRAFPLEDSPFEGGATHAACATCAERARCGGPREDYVAIHGASEFVGIPPSM
jgi:MoaA/NifB/PqqE/SkfB family radical SAM enzyme